MERTIVQDILHLDLLDVSRFDAYLNAFLIDLPTHGFERLTQVVPLDIYSKSENIYIVANKYAAPLPIHLLKLSDCEAYRSKRILFAPNISGLAKVEDVSSYCGRDASCAIFEIDALKGRALISPSYRELASTLLGSTGKFFTGENATIENFLSALHRFDYLVLASHASVPTDDERIGSLIFADGKPSASDTRKQKLKTDPFIFLGCCGSARFNEASSLHGSSSIALSFLEAGASTVLASDWLLSVESMNFSLEEVLQIAGTLNLRDPTIVYDCWQRQIQKMRCFDTSENFRSDDIFLSQVFEERWVPIRPRNMNKQFSLFKYANMLVHARAMV